MTCRLSHIRYGCSGSRAAATTSLRSNRHSCRRSTTLDLGVLCYLSSCALIHGRHEVAPEDFDQRRGRNAENQARDAEELAAGEDREHRADRRDADRLPMIFGTRTLSLMRAMPNMMTCTQTIIHRPCGAHIGTAMSSAISMPMIGIA